jgi:acyl-CoA thioester hydrolase
VSALHEIQIRWSDLDQNRHLRHSVYYDYAALARFKFLSDNGLTTEKLEEFKIGPILFREEAVFLREIRMEDRLELSTELVKSTEDYSRWSIRHTLLKNDDVVATIITVDGAWIDIEKRKLGKPNEFVQNIFSQFQRAVDFELIPAKT